MESSKGGGGQLKVVSVIKGAGSKDSFYPPLSFFYREYVFRMYFLITRLFFYGVSLGNA